MRLFNAETGHAILTAARLDNLLQLLLLAHMPRMSNTLANDLFNGGPLGTFSAKIDLSRALDLIDSATRDAICARSRPFATCLPMPRSRCASLASPF